MAGSEEKKKKKPHKDYSESLGPELPLLNTYIRRKKATFRTVKGSPVILRTYSTTPGHLQQLDNLQDSVSLPEWFPS